MKVWRDPNGLLHIVALDDVASFAASVDRRASLLCNDWPVDASQVVDSDEVITCVRCRTMQLRGKP